MAYYVGTLENSPYVKIEAPYERIVRYLISPELDPSQNELALGLVELPVGSKSDFRAHPEPELFLCIAGHGHIRIGDEMIEMHPFNAVMVPPNVPHQTYNDIGDEVMKFVIVLPPPFGGDRMIIDNWKKAQGIKNTGEENAGE